MSSEKFDCEQARRELREALDSARGLYRVAPDGAFISELIKYMREITEATEIEDESDDIGLVAFGVDRDGIVMRIGVNEVTE